MVLINIFKHIISKTEFKIVKINGMINFNIERLKICYVFTQANKHKLIVLSNTFNYRQSCQSYMHQVNTGDLNLIALNIK